MTSKQKRGSKEKFVNEQPAPQRTIKEKFKVDQLQKLKARTPKQKAYLQSLASDSVVVCLGPAGTGKTYCAAVFAAAKLASGEFEKIILTRPNVPTGRSIGFFPGTIDEKMAPWLAPLTAVIKETLGHGAYECHMKHGNIEMVPLEVIRGRSWDNAIILVDESQNLSIDEIKAVSTRIGAYSKMVFMGDASQSDLETGTKNALNIFCNIIEKYGIAGTSIIEFGADDVVRSDICAALVSAFYREGV